jgi:hypothetical protein
MAILFFDKNNKYIQLHNLIKYIEELLFQLFFYICSIYNKVFILYELFFSNLFINSIIIIKNI